MTKWRNHRVSQYCWTTIPKLLSKGESKWELFFLARKRGLFKTWGRWGRTHERDRGQDIEKERETEGTERRQGKTRWQRSERAESNWVQSGGGTGSLRVGLCLPILMFIWYVSSLWYVLRSSLAEQNLTLSLFRHLSLSYLLSDHSLSYSFCNSHALCSPTLRQFFKTLLFLLRMTVPISVSFGEYSSSDMLDLSYDLLHIRKSKQCHLGI